MKGKNGFYKKEIELIRSILVQTRESGRDMQKSLRNKLRQDYRFYISDFSKSRSGFTPEDFDGLIKNGKITILAE